MPLVYQQNINESSRLAVWHIAEQEHFFMNKVVLPASISHPHKRLQHLAGRYLLTELFEDFPVELIRIADTHKPFLPDEAFHFSISHCGDYAAALVSRTNRVGVDIEMVTEKTERIKDKFLSAEEHQMINEVKGNMSQGHLLTLAWCIKESVFKWFGNGGVDFKKHIRIMSITPDDNQFISSCVFDKEQPVHLKLHGLFFNGNFLTWVLS